MMLKAADDKSERIKFLEYLSRNPGLSASQTRWVREELMRVKKGIQGEKDSAHYLDSYFKNAENHVLLHDLRLVVDDEVAQIDHLVISRGHRIYLIETKNFSGNLLINAHGEFTVKYDDAQFGIPSPMEQSRRHERILNRLLERLDIVGRTQKQLDFHHVVMLHPKAIITRPNAKLLDTNDVIKADQFPTWHGRFVESIGVGAVFKTMLNLRSLETIKEHGEKLIAQHQPANQFALPDFMRGTELSSSSRTPMAMTASPQPTQVAVSPVLVPPPVPPTATNELATEPAKRLVCAHCGLKISYPEGKFCWNNPKRFNGLQYCREHQSQF